MKKADAIKAVIQNIKDQNRSSFGPEDIERLRKVYSGRLTGSIISDFQAEAIREGIEYPDKFDLEEYLPSERKYGDKPKKIVAEPSPTSVGPTSKGLGATRGITFTEEGLTFLLAEIEQSPDSINTSYLNEPFTGRKFTSEEWKAQVKLDKERGTIKTAFNPVLRSVFDKLKNYGDPREFFPDIPLSDIVPLEEMRMGRRIRTNAPLDRQIVDAYLDALWKRGWLEDADPNFEAADTKFKGLEKNYQNRGSEKGRQIIDTKKKKGIPVVIGADLQGNIVYSPDEVRPYSLRLSDKGRAHLDSVRTGKSKIFIGKDAERVTKVVSNIPIVAPVQDKIPPATQTIDEQLRESRKTYYQTRAIRGDEPPLANKVTSPRTGITYDNYNALVSAEGPVRPPGGETVEPNRGEASRRAKGAIIARRDVQIFKQAMANAVSINPQLPTHPLLDESGKPNLFKGIMTEARKIDPTISMNAMQDIKDYLFFTGYLEADTAVSEKLGPSRLSDADVPEYVKPTQKYYSSGLNILDAGGENEPLVIRKLSADPDMDDVRRGAKPITGPEPDKPKTRSRLMDIIKQGGRGGVKALPGAVGLPIGILMAGDVKAEETKKFGVPKDPESFALENIEMATGVVYDVDPKDGKPRPGRRTGLPLEVLNQMLRMGRPDLIEKAADDWEKRQSLQPEVRKQIEETRALYEESRKTTVPVQEQEEFKLKALYPSGQKPGYRHPGSGHTGLPPKQRRSNQPSFLERD